ESDSGSVDRGWFLDDIEIVERQVLSVPLAVHTQSGLDGQVPIAWVAPAGIDPPAPDTPLQGYHVYRATPADLTAATRLTSSLVSSPSFTDMTAANGQLYYYAVTASYGGVESKPSAAAAGEAYVAGYAANATALDVHAIATPVDTTITFTNTG